MKKNAWVTGNFLKNKKATIFWHYSKVFLSAIRYVYHAGFRDIEMLISKLHSPKMWIFVLCNRTVLLPMLSGRQKCTHVLIFWGRAGYQWYRIMHWPSFKHSLFLSLSHDWVMEDCKVITNSGQTIQYSLKHHHHVWKTTVKINSQWVTLLFSTLPI